MDIPNPYTLPTIEFVGGESQELLFNVYFYKNRKPFSMIGCTSNFSVVDFTNKKGSRKWGRVCVQHPVCRSYTQRDIRIIR